MLAVRRAAASRLLYRPAIRSFSAASVRLAAHPPAEKANDSLIGPGGKPGTVPTDIEQSTGLERQELLAKLQGKELFDMEPLHMTHLGTKSNPIIIKSADPHRFVGCTGYPVDSHDTIWLTVRKDHGIDRCPECGSVFKLEQEGEGHDH